MPGAAGLAYAGLFNGADGKLVRGKGVKSSVRTGTGAYQVVFDREAKTCVHIAVRSTDEPGQIAAVSDATERVCRERDDHRRRDAGGPLVQPGA